MMDETIFDDFLVASILPLLIAAVRNCAGRNHYDDTQWALTTLFTVNLDVLILATVLEQFWGNMWDCHNESRREVSIVFGLMLLCSFFFSSTEALVTARQIGWEAQKATSLRFFVTPAANRQFVRNISLHAFITNGSSSIAENKQSSYDKPTRLTVILPAYNEALRIEETLKNYHSFLCHEWRQQMATQILVVDDGSTDGTAKVVEEFSFTIQKEQNNVIPNEQNNLIRQVPVHCVSLENNQGKGAALARGIQHVAKDTEGSDQAEVVLLADADASADITCLVTVLQCLGKLLAEQKRSDITSDKSSSSTTTTPINWNLPALIVGRRVDDTSTEMDRAVLRWGFRTAVAILCGNLGVSDSQCGFKLMTLSAGLKLYPELHLQGWSHDVEVLYRAKLLGIPVAEENVQWQDKPGSKLVTSAGGTVAASLRMLLEVAQIRFLYVLGLWKLPGE